MEFEIIIRRLSAVEHRLRVIPETTVLQLKHKLELATEIPSPRQRLIYQGQVLKDDQAMSALGLEEGYVIHLVERVIPQNSTTTERQQGEVGEPVTSTETTPNPLAGITTGPRRIGRMHVVPMASFIEVNGLPGGGVPSPAQLQSLLSGIMGSMGGPNVHMAADIQAIHPQGPSVAMRMHFDGNQWVIDGPPTNETQASSEASSEAPATTETPVAPPSANSSAEGEQAPANEAAVAEPLSQSNATETAPTTQVVHPEVHTVELGNPMHGHDHLNEDMTEAQLIALVAAMRRDALTISALYPAQPSDAQSIPTTLVNATAERGRMGRGLWSVTGLLEHMFAIMRLCARILGDSTSLTTPNQQQAAQQLIHNMAHFLHIIGRTSDLLGNDLVQVMFGESADDQQSMSPEQRQVHNTMVALVEEAMQQAANPTTPRTNSNPSTEPTPEPAPETARRSHEPPTLWGPHAAPIGVRPRSLGNLVNGGGMVIPIGVAGPGGAFHAFPTPDSNIFASLFRGGPVGTQITPIGPHPLTQLIASSPLAANTTTTTTTTTPSTTTDRPTSNTETTSTQPQQPRTQTGAGAGQTEGGERGEEEGAAHGGNRFGHILESFLFSLLGLPRSSVTATTTTTTDPSNVPIPHPSNAPHPPPTSTSTSTSTSSSTPSFSTPSVSSTTVAPGIGEGGMVLLDQPITTTSTSTSVEEPITINPMDQSDNVSVEREAGLRSAMAIIGAAINSSFGHISDIADTRTIRQVINSVAPSDIRSDLPLLQLVAHFMDGLQMNHFLQLIEDRRTNDNLQFLQSHLISLFDNQGGDPYRSLAAQMPLPAPPALLETYQMLASNHLRVVERRLQSLHDIVRVESQDIGAKLYDWLQVSIVAWMQAMIGTVGSMDIVEKILIYMLREIMEIQHLPAVAVASLIARSYETHSFPSSVVIPLSPPPSSSSDASSLPATENRVVKRRSSSTCDQSMAAKHAK
eukprot:Ihof_evm1s371 gene=Ihof_evmTU1s371